MHTLRTVVLHTMWSQWQYSAAHWPQCQPAALPKHQELTVYTYLPTVQLPLTAQYYEYMVIS